MIKKETLIAIILIAVIFIMNLVLDKTVGLYVFPLIKPDFCDDTMLPFICKTTWKLIEITGLIIIGYLFITRKKRERIT